MYSVWFAAEASELQKFYSQWGTVKAFSKVCLCSLPNKKMQDPIACGSTSESLYFRDIAVPEHSISREVRLNS